MKFFSNKEIAKLLRSVAAAYSVTGGNNFKVVAYNQAADNIEHLTSELKDLWEDNQLDTVAGLGVNMRAYIDELFKTGHVKHFETLKKDIPHGMFELLDLTGMGPKNAYKLAKELNIKTVADLEKAAKMGKIRKLPGFGEKSEGEIVKSISEFKPQSTRQDLPSAFAVAQRVIEHMKTSSACEKIEPLGSLRRMVETIGDVDIAVASKKPQEVINHFKTFREVARILGAGYMASSIILENGIQVDLKVQPPEAFGALLQHFTGSKYHNISLREFALKKGMSLSEHGIKYKGKLYKFPDEVSLYKFLGLDYIEPELREDNGEIAAAMRSAQGKSDGLPKLVELKDIKGDLHIHSDYPIEPSHDLGISSQEVLVKRALQLKYEYLGLSDHSPGVSNHTKTQIIELIKGRKDKIEHLKTSFKSIRILNLLEIDILASGELSVPPEGLSLLDGAIAGIHSNHNQDKAAITKRLLTAIDHPKVKVISHPTGRMLGQREGSDADWETIFKACAKTNTFLEINAWPTRLDLPDLLVFKAKKIGVKFVTSTDSHDVKHMDNMNFAISVARRGWATKKDIVNSLPSIEFARVFGI